ncbi:MAG: alanine racemase [Pseudomonadota bacterium]|nr:alanine racemase [Pseudomonadota bacterium]MED5443407.1 alanine racemase [Pseudomonadota bacterium]
MASHRYARALIDLPAFQSNLALARRCAGSRAVYAVVKADAYGHGMASIVGAAEAADGFCVADLDEGLQLRALVPERPIVVLQGAHDRAGMAAAAQAALTLVLHTPEQVAGFADGLRSGDAPAVPWLELDSGMHRLGLDPPALAAAKAQLEAKGLSPTVMTHFACADTPGAPLHEQQRGAAVALAAPSSACNSAALLAGEVTEDQVVRPGIMLYGGASLAEQTPEALGLAPVMTLTSRILAVRTVPVGSRVGYGASWEAPRESRIATVALGYGDGYPRTLPHGTPVLTAAGIAPLVGRVSMDSLTIDVTDLPSVGLGDQVTLWGKGLPVDRLAAALGTIGYELLTRLGPRVPRVVEGSAHG